MIILGLTGSIAMGKSVVVSLLRKQHIPVWDADHAVHQLLAKGGAAVASVAKLFPESLSDGAIDRRKVGENIFNHPEKLASLEKILHPLVRKSEQEFIKKSALRKEPLVVVDIPLLFELNREIDYDAVVVVTAPAFIQQQRALKRAGMTPEKLRLIIAKQMPDSEKRRKADYILHSSLGKAFTNRQIKSLINSMIRQQPCVK